MMKRTVAMGGAFRSSVAGLSLLCALGAVSTVRAESISLDVKLGTPVMIERSKRTAYLKVGLTGVRSSRESARTPVNVALVLDRSGSMSGEKIRKAREAALMAIERLDDEDIVSLVAYNHTVEVLVPATRLRDRTFVRRQVERLFADGNTALFAGVAKGAHELRKFIERNRVNRVVLLSDGLANVGPSSPGELGDLGWSLAKEGISVSTIGLGTGYNEDLMVALAAASDGNHAFAENASDLARIFALEFGDVTSVVAQQVVIRILCSPGTRPVRVLGRRGEINGREVVATLNQVYAEQEKYLLVELEVEGGKAGSEREVASVRVSYADTVSRSTASLDGRARVRFSESRSEVERSRDRTVMVASVEQIANERSKRAVELRDKGRTREAVRLMQQNAEFLEEEGAKYESKKLKKGASRSRRAARRMPSKADYQIERKQMRKEQFEADMQQAW